MKKKKYKVKKCLNCGENIKKKKTESIPFYKKRKFCSTECQHKYITKERRLIIKCDNCGKKFNIKKSRRNKHNFCSLKCFGEYRHKKGIIKVECSWCGKEFNKANTQIGKHNFCSRECFGNWQSKFLIGENGYNWQGGISTLNDTIRSSKKMIEWRIAVLKRDNFACQHCGDRVGGNLEAHHKKQLSTIIKDNNIKTIYDAIKCKELWNIDNGITLCKKCHMIEHFKNNKK